jgi:hypothetical protein
MPIAACGGLLKNACFEPGFFYFSALSLADCKRQALQAAGQRLAVSRQKKCFMFGIDEQKTNGRNPIGLTAVRRCLLGAALLAGLGGCSGFGEQGISSALVTPGKYEFHSCQEIENSIQNRRARLIDLEKLMADASQGVGGGFVGAITYRPEYMQNRGEIAELVKTAQNKQCVIQRPLSSQRAVF